MINKSKWRKNDIFVQLEGRIMRSKNEQDSASEEYEYAH